MKIEIKILNKEFYNSPSCICSMYDECDCQPRDPFKQELPSYSTSGSAGIDLICTEDVTIYPGEVKAIHTGLAIWIGSHSDNLTAVINKETISSLGVAGVITPRSGLGTRGLVLANLTGLIDEDYQGELIVQAWNRNTFFDNSDIEDWIPDNPIRLKAGDRFAQLVFVPVIKAQWDVVEEFSNKTDRGTRGFGSTGGNNG